MATTSHLKKHGVTGPEDPGGAVYVSPDPSPDGARIWFFTRLGGVSEEPFDSLNVSVKVGDEREAVSENLSRIKNALGDRPTAWIRQVAGSEVLRVREKGFAGEADATVTDVEGLALVVAVADCVPVALAGDGEVGMVHSGWRGTLSGISGKAVHAMGSQGVRAYIGPCIRRCCYEVSEEMVEDFTSIYGTDVADGRYLSLPDVIVADLAAAGVEEVYDTGLCTACRTDLFYSHRKEKPATGRTLAAIARAS